MSQSELASPATRRSFALFAGPHGLRAGWSILLFLALTQGLIFLFSQAVPRALRSTNSSAVSPLALYLIEAIPLVSVAAATFIMAKIERRPVAAFYLADRRGLRHLLTGLAWGTALISLLVFLLKTLGLLVVDRRLLSAPAALRYGLIWLGGFTLVALFEESFSRGYLQFTLARGLAALYRGFSDEHRERTLGFWSAALLLSFLFGFNHRANPGESPLGLATAALAGLVFCLSLWRTGSLWWAVGFHTAWDWAQSFLYGVADSGFIVQGHLLATHPAGKPLFTGGATGPEGSLLAVPVLALAALTLFTRYHGSPSAPLNPEPSS